MVDRLGVKGVLSGIVMSGVGYMREKIGGVKKRDDKSKRRGDYAHKDRQRGTMPTETDEGDYTHKDRWRGLHPQRQTEGTVPTKTDRGDYAHKKEDDEEGMTVHERTKRQWVSMCV